MRQSAACVVCASFYVCVLSTCLFSRTAWSVPVDLPYLLFKIQTFLSNVKQSLSCPCLSPGLVIDPSFHVQQIYPTGMSAVFLIERHMADDVHESVLKNIFLNQQVKRKSEEKVYILPFYVSCV